MTIEGLRNWQFENTLEDQWWLSMDGVSEETLLTLSEIEEVLSLGEYADVRALHASQASMANPPWINLATAPPPLASTSIGASVKDSRPSEVLGSLILLLPLGATILIWFWIGKMNLLQKPGSALTVVMLITIILTGVLVGIEASFLKIGKNEKRTGPIGWAVVVMLFWIIGYPCYLFWRSRYGAKNLIIGALLVMIIFLGCGGLVGFAIETSLEEARRALRDLGRATSLTSSSTIDTSISSVREVPEIANRIQPEPYAPPVTPKAKSQTKNMKYHLENARKSKRGKSISEMNALEQLADTVERNAIAKWPDDFAMQRYTMSEQMEAIGELGVMDQVAAKMGMPDRTYKAIQAKAVSDWPEDFTMQRYKITQEIAAWKGLQ